MVVMEPFWGTPRNTALLHSKAPLGMSRRSPLLSAPASTVGAEALRHGGTGERARQMRDSSPNPKTRAQG